MSDLTIKHAGVEVSSNSAGSSISTGKRKSIIITPTITTATLDGGDVLINSVEIPNAVKEDGGCSILHSITLVDYDDAEIDLDMVITQNSFTLGAVNAEPSATAAEIAAAKVLGVIQVDRSDPDSMDLGGAKVQHWTRQSIDVDTSSHKNRPFPIYLQAASGSTSVYFSLVTAANTWGANDLEFHFNIEY